ncbi:hypothetical protein CRG98_029960 [Punica granatum]|uniref:Uncharacterized protein n=1 Tax=Punica granatum TaxID=22663 RepID=A0A2I0J0W0_PUNGR|nr:hypothetical protein CRG98_029960 [Punica granatum]
MGRSGAVIAPIWTTTATDEVANNLMSNRQPRLGQWWLRSGPPLTPISLSLHSIENKGMERLEAVVTSIPATTTPDEVVGCLEVADDLDRDDLL